ncbi:MAG: S9 family peptidase [Chloroflexi bacterium]|nr:S9 family peptidase [Chloroflexota bacterium]
MPQRITRIQGLRLITADKDFDVLVPPNERHGLRSAAVRRYVERRTVDFLERNPAPGS